MSAVTVAEMEDAGEQEEQITRCAENVIEAIKQDYSLRFPIAPEQQQNEFAVWLTDCRARYRPLMEAMWLALDADNADLRLRWLFAEEKVWRQVREFLLTYAVLFKAGDWVRRKLGDAVALEQPVRSGDGWRIPIGLLKYGFGMGQIVMDADGNIRVEQTTTKEQLRQAIDDRKLSATAAAFGK